MSFCAPTKTIDSESARAARAESARIAAADDNAQKRGLCLARAANGADKNVVPFAAPQPPDRQRDHAPVPAAARARGGGVDRGRIEMRQIDAARREPQFRLVRAQDIFGVREGGRARADDAREIDHRAAVSAAAIESVQSRHGGQAQFAVGEAKKPRRDAASNVRDVGRDLGEQGAQAQRPRGRGERIFRRDFAVKMRAAVFFDFGGPSAAARNHDAVDAAPREFAVEIDDAALDAARVQARQNLRDFHPRDLKKQKQKRAARAQQKPDKARLPRAQGGGLLGRAAVGVGRKKRQRAFDQKNNRERGDQGVHRGRFVVAAKAAFIAQAAPRVK